MTHQQNMKKLALMFAAAAVATSVMTDAAYCEEKRDINRKYSFIMYFEICFIKTTLQHTL